MATTWIECDDGKRYDVEPPHPAAPFAEMAGPACKCGSTKVRGRDVRREGHDGYFAAGFCADCNAYRGTLRARVSTIFGIEEDELVLNGRPRVY